MTALTVDLPYPDMVVTAAEAVARIRPGQRVFLGTGAGQPQALIEALLARARHLPDVEIVHLVTHTDPAFRHAELAAHFALHRFFVEPTDGQGPVAPGDAIPVFLSDIHRLFDSGQLPLDVALIQVTPPDARGLCSLGLSVDITRDAAANAGLVIAQVNGHLPHTGPDSVLALHDIDYLVVDDRPLIEVPAAAVSDTGRQIAEHVVPLVPDGATLAVGTQPLTQAVLRQLGGKRDLGIHTDVLCDAVLDLMVGGAVTGQRKSLDRGKVVATLCQGTQRLYDALDHHPTVTLRPADAVCDPGVVSRQRQPVALAVGLEVDLTGQVCAGTWRGAASSGMDSRADFIQGAARAPAGRVIVTLAATDPEGTRSRIVPHLAPGAQVAARATDVHYVVTEFGVAYLRGQSLADRALALITIAGPDFRADLLRAAIDAGVLRADLSAVEGTIQIQPPRFQTALVLENGTQIQVRPLHPTDERSMRDLFNALSRETLYYRFMSRIPRVPRKQIQEFVYVDYREEMALVATLPAAHGEEIVAVGRYYLIPKTNEAEVAFIVRDTWQHRGIGTFLFNTLKTLAQNNGITGFRAEVLADNLAMLAVFQKSGCRVSSHVEDHVQSLALRFDTP